MIELHADSVHSLYHSSESRCILQCIVLNIWGVEGLTSVHRNVYVIDEFRILWGKCEQATEEKKKYQQLLSVS